VAGRDRACTREINSAVFAAPACHEIRTVELYRAQSDVVEIRDLPAGFARDHQRQHFLFAAGKDFSHGLRLRAFTRQIFDKARFVEEVEIHVVRDPDPSGSSSRSRRSPATPNISHTSPAATSPSSPASPSQRQWCVNVMPAISPARPAPAKRPIARPP